MEASAVFCVWQNAMYWDFHVEIHMHIAMVLISFLFGLETQTNLASNSCLVTYWLYDFG